MMKMVTRAKSTQMGGLLIEVIIAVVVIGVGLLAILQLQGSLQTSSGDAKVRAEALAFATAKADQLKTYIEKSQFDENLANAIESDSQTGTNADFIRQWVITDEGTITNLKKVIVKVSWTDVVGNTKHVLINNLVTFSDPSKTAAMWIKEYDPLYEDGEDPFSSPFKSGVEGYDPSTGDQEELLSSEDDLRTDEEKATDILAGVTIKNYDGGNVEVIKDGTVVLTAFGGKVNRIGGYIHFVDGDFITDSDGDGALDDADVASIRMLASSPSYCEFPIAGGSNPERAKYVCYAPADCSETADSTNGCPANASSLRDLDGGWYGQVGIYGTDEPICTADTILGTVSSGGKPTPARNYVSLRLATGTGNHSCQAGFTGYLLGGDPLHRVNYCIDGTKYDILSTEGINTPYICHNFLVKPTGSCLGSAVSEEVNIISSEVVRTLVGTDHNIVEVMNEDACMIMIIGNIEDTNNGGDITKDNPSVTLASSPPGQGCIVTNISGSKQSATYACWVPRGAVGGVTFSATSTPTPTIPTGCPDPAVTCNNGDSNFTFIAPVSGDSILGPDIEM